MPSPEKNAEDDRYLELATLRIVDREYKLIHRLCEQCGARHYRVYRFSGSSFACYKLSDDFEVADFEAFARGVDEELLQSSADMLDSFRYHFDKENSAHGIEADFSRRFLVMEYARHRLSKLQKLGLLASLESSAPPQSEIEEILRLGFELGAAVSEHQTMVIWEDYMWEGIAVSSWRESGLPKARQERLRQGARTRKAIVDASTSLYQRNPDLLRSDTQTARAILKLDLPELQYQNGRRISIDTITKHLRAARKIAKHLGKS